MDFGGILVIVVFILVLIYIHQKKNARDRVRNERIRNSTRIDGEIIGIKHQTGFDRERARERGYELPIELKVKYVSPVTGQEETVLHKIKKDMPDLHTYVAGAAGIISVGSKGFKIIAMRHKQMMKYRADLEAQGKSKEEIDERVKEISLRMAADSHGSLGDSVEADNFITVQRPIKVNLYFYNLPADEEFILAFRPEEELEYYAKDYFN